MRGFLGFLHFVQITVIRIMSNNNLMRENLGIVRDSVATGIIYKLGSTVAKRLQKSLLEKYL